MRASSVLCASAALLTRSLTVTATPPSPCCAYGGSGAATLFGNAVLDLQTGKGAEVVSMLFGIDPVSSTSSVIVNSTDPEKSVAGWIIGQSGSVQTLTFWNGNVEGGAPVCKQVQLKAPESFIPGFLMCPGISVSSLFPVFGASYTAGTASFDMYLQPGTGFIGSFLNATEGCAPVSMLAGGSPLGNGAWSVSFLSGTAARPPAAWLSPPSFCAALL